jgi:uncharacterized LabA/DUF88 family protein
MIRVVSFIDGFNLYHTIRRLRADHLKWVDLWQLSERLISKRTETLVAVYYFSAYAFWMPDREKRHRAYIGALESRGVTPVLGRFKPKDQPYRCCFGCYHKHPTHEEKETDVNIALYLLNDAYQDRYDAALLISRDSDLVPAARMVKRLFPEKEIVPVAPPYAGHSADLLTVASRKKKLGRRQIEECLLPERLVANDGSIVNRPVNYAPPG